MAHHVSWDRNVSYPNKLIMNHTCNKRAYIFVCKYLIIANIFYLRIKWNASMNLHDPDWKSGFWLFLSDLWVPAMSSVTLIFSISCAGECPVTHDKLISFTVAPCSFVGKTTDYFFCYLKKGGVVFVSDVELQGLVVGNSSRCFSPVHLNCW